VEQQQADRTSILQLYRRLIDLRRSHSVLVAGALENVASDQHVLRYERGSGEERVLVLLNFSSEAAMISLEKGTILLSTGLAREGEAVRGAVELNGAEGLILLSPRGRRETVPE
jgi:alpha-glucosidase